MKIDEFESLKQELIDNGEISQLEFGNCLQLNKIFVRNGVYALSSKKIESLIRIAEMQR